MSKQNKPPRIIFQPTEESSKKIQHLLNNSDITISQLMNLIIMNIPNDVKAVIKFTSEKEDNL